MLDTDSTFGTSDITCDREGCSSDFTHDGFDGHYDIVEACKEARAFGWVIKKIDGEWVHYCCTGCYEIDNKI